MASARKKQDEKNLKTLRELATLPYNKYCFDCNQRGPTYVNVTIGSFVCTKCSGMLRGITPPHRVKSISMASFTIEEVDLLRNRGNDYCKRIWLGLYEGNPPTECRDEQAVRDFMVNKYERKRYYLEPSQALRNGYAKPEPSRSSALPETKPLKTLVSDPKPIRINGNLSGDNHRKRPESHRNNVDFVADFDKADIFSSSTNNSSSNNNHKASNGVQGGFANFDNNPIFDSRNGTRVDDDDFSIFDLKFESCGPVLNQVPLFPRCNINNRWSMPAPLSVNNMNQQQNVMNKVPAPPPEDKYAALKDLDNALKTQNALDWSSSNGSNGSLYSSPTPTGSMYSSPSPQSSIFGSPSQGHFMNVFAPQENGMVNPFNNGGINWQNGTNGVMGGLQQQTYVNPFRTIDTTKMNGFSHNFQPTVFPVMENGTTPWAANPFKVGAAATMKSNNPFL